MLEAPSGLLCELADACRGVASIARAQPSYGWVVNDTASDAVQRGYRVLVATSRAMLDDDRGDVWDSGRVASSQSLHVRHEGRDVATGRTFHWKVRTWGADGVASPWSKPQRFDVVVADDVGQAGRLGLVKTRVGPERLISKADGSYFVAFAKAGFGAVELTLASERDGEVIEVHLGEKLAGPDTIDRTPPGTIRYRKMCLTLKRGTHIYEVAIDPDARNTAEGAILMPPEMGEVMPFRYCEIVGHTAPIGADDIRQVMVHYPFDDHASPFSSSDETLDAVWDLCKHTIKATSFCGLYVDGDRERLPYEADAYQPVEKVSIPLF